MTKEMIEAAVVKLEYSDERPLRLSEIAAELNVCERTLRGRFLKHFGVAPSQYLLTRRLTAARGSLTRPERQEITVTEIALQHHFSELGRFSVRYRRMFGECPSLTLQRSKQEAPKRKAWKVAGTACTATALNGH